MNVPPDAADRPCPRERLAHAFSQFDCADGATPLPLDGLQIFRSSNETPRTPVVYEPSLIIVGQGRKRGYLAGQEFEYNPEHYLALSVPLPLECQVVEASEEEPFLALRILLDAPLLRELILQVDEGFEPVPAAQTGICVSRLSDPLRDAVLRLLESQHPAYAQDRSPTARADARVLGPLLLREVLYRVLGGEQGDYLRAFAMANGHFHKIARVLRAIHEDASSPFDVPAMAKMAGMGTSTFHDNFKAITSLSPLQYIKTIRLHLARSLMLHERANASEASRQVGYESASQFSREFRRLFGRPPTEEIAHFRESGTLPPGLIRPRGA